MKNVIRDILTILVTFVLILLAIYFILSKICIK